MELCARQLAPVKSPDINSECTGHFPLILSIPCCHKIKKFIEQKRKFTSEDFHEHWCQERDDLESEIDLWKHFHHR